MAKKSKGSKGNCGNSASGISFLKKATSNKGKSKRNR